MVKSKLESRSYHFSSKAHSIFGAKNASKYKEIFCLGMKRGMGFALELLAF